MTNHHKTVTVLPHKRVCLCSNQTGDASAEIYTPFPGVEVAYVAAHTDCFDFDTLKHPSGGPYVELHYCAQGRMEQVLDGAFFYLMPGDCSVALIDRPIGPFQMPTRHYHGISIGIDTQLASDSFPPPLGDLGLCPLAAASFLCGASASRVLRASSPLRILFSQLYAIPEPQRRDYLKLKLPELFYLLCRTDHTAAGSVRSSVPRPQVDFVRQVSRYISQNIHQRLTVRTLTREFGVSDTYLQTAFRSVYGMPVISFIRAQKMQSAAQLLIHTDHSIDAVAQQFGYENESKFSAAFKKIIGDSPSVFRREHSKLRIL